MKPLADNRAINPEFPWYATNEKREVLIVKPRKVIMGNWLLCRSKQGEEWYVPFPELRVNYLSETP